MFFVGLSYSNEDFPVESANKKEYLNEISTNLVFALFNNFIRRRKEYTFGKILFKRKSTILTNNINKYINFAFKFPMRNFMDLFKKKDEYLVQTPILLNNLKKLFRMAALKLLLKDCSVIANRKSLNFLINMCLMNNKLKEMKLLKEKLRKW